MHVGYSNLIPCQFVVKNLTSIWAPKMEGKYVAHACSFSPHSPTCIHALAVHAIRNELALQKCQTKTVVGQTSHSIVRT